MEIRLIRHGKPTSAQNPKLTALGFLFPAFLNISKPFSVTAMRQNARVESFFFHETALVNLALLLHNAVNISDKRIPP